MVTTGRNEKGIEEAIDTLRNINLNMLCCLVVNAIKFLKWGENNVRLLRIIYPQLKSPTLLSEVYNVM